MPEEYWKLRTAFPSSTYAGIGDGDEYCSVVTASPEQIKKELAKHNRKRIDDLVSSSSQYGYLGYDLEKEYWYDCDSPGMSRISNLKNHYINDFKENLKEAKNPNSPYADWGEEEQNTLVKYLEELIKQLNRIL